MENDAEQTDRWRQASALSAATRNTNHIPVSLRSSGHRNPTPRPPSSARRPAKDGRLRRGRKPQRRSLRSQRASVAGKAARQRRQTQVRGRFGRNHPGKAAKTSANLQRSRLDFGCPPRSPHLACGEVGTGRSSVPCPRARPPPSRASRSRSRHRAGGTAADRRQKG